MQYIQTIKTGNVISGRDFREMFAAATEWLGKSVPEINALNVFPVPDGDTGTNMHLTMQSCVEAASQLEDMSAGSVVNAMSRGALLGARGNSGVILSQIWRGLQQGLSDKDHISCKDLAYAFQQAAVAAREGLSNPVEGTILTVMKEVAGACQRGVEKGKQSITGILQIAVDAAGEAVAQTPHQLPVLMEAGVVDAGGQGLYTILEGALLSLKDNRSQLQTGKTTIIGMKEGQSNPRPLLSPDNEEPYGYCTEFLLKGQDLDPDVIRDNLKDKGESLIVVGADNAVRIHIHAIDPSDVLHYAVTHGTVHDISIRNMDEQVADRLAKQKSEEARIQKGVAVISISLGDGLSSLFHQLGAAAVVPGGQTMNPSTRDILGAIESVPFTDIIILPNNKNVVPAAQKTIALCDKQVTVLPTTSLPQGISAMVTFEPAADLQTNIEAMQEAITSVKTVEITRASRSTKVNGFNIHKNQFIGLLDGKLVACADRADGAVEDTLAALDLSNSEMITIYYGADSTRQEADEIVRFIGKYHKKLESDIIAGGQPHYNYIISIE